MKFISIVRSIYIFLTIYMFLILSITTLKILDVLPGILIMWISYFMFYMGSRNNVTYNIIFTSDPSYIWKSSKKSLFFISIITIIISIVVTRFYTGHLPSSVLQSLFQGESLYFQYQNYFNINKIGVFSLSKLPFIFMLIYSSKNSLIIPININ
jgi:hypothetical protein